jgi:peptidoglycan/xylan/chitin deacetylase (PgdA/CDA1 family)
VDLGAHTVTHPILSRVQEKADLRREIEGSKERIEEQTGLSVLHFCYPNGKWQDFDTRVVEMVRHARFETAVTTEPGLNFQGADPLRLLRIGVTPDYPEPYFESCAAAFRV